MTSSNVLSRLRRFFAAILCVAAAGCARSQAPPPEVPGVPTLTDEAILAKLDFLEPVFMLDAERRVVRIRLTGRHLTGEALVEVGKLTALQQMDLYGTTITDDGLTHLKDLQKLRNLGLGGTTITDKGLAHLEKLEDLRYLWLPKQTVTEDGADRLKNARAGLHVYLQ